MSRPTARVLRTVCHSHSITGEVSLCWEHEGSAGPFMHPQPLTAWLSPGQLRTFSIFLTGRIIFFLLAVVYHKPFLDDPMFIV